MGIDDLPKVKYEEPGRLYCNREERTTYPLLFSLILFGPCTALVGSSGANLHSAHRGNLIYSLLSHNCKLHIRVHPQAYCVILRDNYSDKLQTSVWKQTYCFICRPSDSTVPEDAGIEPKTAATMALIVRCSNHSARSPPMAGIKR